MFPERTKFQKSRKIKGTFSKNNKMGILVMMHCCFTGHRGKGSRVGKVIESLVKERI